jgi:hypothetical protein
MADDESALRVGGSSHHWSDPAMAGPNARAFYSRGHGRMRAAAVVNLRAPQDGAAPIQCISFLICSRSSGAHCSGFS